MITRGLEIGGTFLIVEGDGYDEYLGTVTIGLKIGRGGKKALSLSAVGSFADYSNSGKFGLFLYLAANYPFGGPPFFFVTGLAGGFGYNFGLIVPPLEELVEFPLVDEAIQGKGQIDPAETAAIIAEELEALKSYMPPEIGAGFGSVGVKFTCFKIIDGYGSITIAIGSSDFELDLLGIATIMLPTTVETRFEPLAVAEKVLQARFNPCQGVLLIRGQLTPSSYIFSRNCHLTGGFAYGLWFLGERAGDFVITQGGYHPLFNLDGRYPDVPRLGFSWQIDNNAFTTAQTYFALCGSGVMAGGLFAIAFKAGSLWAEFDAGVNFLLGWKPYHYDISLHLHIRAGIGTLAVGLGVSVHFWGPDFGCKFKIKIVIVTVTIKIGDQSSIYPLPIEWAEFEEAFLPAPDEVCSIAVVEGLTKQLVRGEGESAEDIWVINPKDLELTTDSLIPAKQAFTWNEDQSLETEKAFAINSMGVTSDQLETAHKITITKDDSEDDAKEKFSFEPITKLAPTAVWGLPNMSGGHIKPPEVDSEQFIENVFFGFRIVPAQQPKPGETHTIGVEHLLYDPVLVDKAYTWATLTPFIADSTLTDEQAKRDRIQSTIETNDARDNLLAALGFDVSYVDIKDANAIADGFIFAPQVR